MGSATSLHFSTKSIDLFILFWHNKVSTLGVVPSPENLRLLERKEEVQWVK